MPEITWGKFQKKFHVWGPLVPKPLVCNFPKSVLYNYIHPWACLQKFIPIAQYLRGVMSWKTHSPQLGRRKRKKKRSQNNRLESHVWSQISGKPVKIKNLNFFEATGKFPYFDMLQDGSHGSNCLGVKNRSRPESCEFRSNFKKILTTSLLRF